MTPDAHSITPHSSDNPLKNRITVFVGDLIVRGLEDRRNISRNFNASTRENAPGFCF
jgi:hypothetical protein